MGVFRVRLNCVDHYQGTQTKFDPRLRNDIRDSQIAREPKVPIIRVFGSTETGQKVCAHVHGAFPYLFVEYPGILASREVGTYIHRLHPAIDHALAVSYRQDVYREDPKFVARITLVKGVPFYGFHVGYRFYLKIYLYNPVVITRLADLLQQGVILQRKFQPYEAHLQYLLQFMTDYNLYGCGYLEAGRVMFRSPVPQVAEDGDTPHLWHSQSIRPEQVATDLSLPRVSHCSIEVDICVQDILNRKAVSERQLHHDFVERANPIPEGMKLVPSMAGLWKDETKRRKKRMQVSSWGGDADSASSSPFPPEALVSMSSCPRDSQPQGWIHEEEYREQIRELIDGERRADPKTGVSFDGFVTPVPFERTVKTVMRSVEDLFPQILMPALGIADPLMKEEDKPSSGIDGDNDGTLASSNGQRESDLYPSDIDEELYRATKVAEASNEPPPSNQEAAAGYTATFAKPGSTSNVPKKADVRAYGTLARPKQNLHPKAQSSSTVPGFRGVTRTGLQTGRPTEMPLFPELIAGADLEGLVTEFSLSHKRPGSPTSAKLQGKRQKLTESSTVHDTDLHDSDQTTNADQSSACRSSSNSQQSPKTSFQQLKRPPAHGDPAKRSGARTLNYAVVKDPNDPSTKLRLSQQTSSQGSDSLAVDSKGVSFAPLSSSSEQQSTERASSGGTESRIPETEPGTCSPASPDDADRLTGSWSSSGWTPNAKTFVIRNLPPSAAEVCATLTTEYGMPNVIYQDAYYSNEKDVPVRPREYAGREFRLESNTLPFLPDFDATGHTLACFGIKEGIPDRAALQRGFKKKREECKIRSWEIADLPPTYQEVQMWWLRKQKTLSEHDGPDGAPAESQGTKPELSQLEGPTPKNKHGFKYTQTQRPTSVQHEAQYMSTMSLELHVNTRGKLVPNPEEDEVQCVFWCLKSDETSPESISQPEDSVQAGVVVLSPDGSLAHEMRRQTTTEVVAEGSELDLMVRMVEIVRSHDPDVLTGYEVHGNSWGYLIERARFKYDYNLCDEFSRVKSQSHGRFGKEADRWGFNTTSTIRVTGRHMINIWRAMRAEVNLLQYTMENVVWQLLHRRIPHYSWRTLSDWYKSGRPRDMGKVLRYYVTRTRLDISILERNELIPRTSEQARLLGVDFFSVFSRGSQFKIESIMFRIAKPENFLLVSPNRKQVGGQNALECLPLVMEPESAFYNSPVVVLDFQSLYPSVMIAYNYCYSTFLGRIVNWRGTNKMGFTEYRRRAGLLELLKDHINIAPNGMMYAKAEIRKSLLAKMLTEILETRVMVKSGMKQDKDDKTLQQLLNNRQLALKLLANVTYGYTSASFSGRMPCAEIADSIVQTSRETLERAVAHIHSINRWGAEVVYGDTDSLFVYLRGRTRDEAFDIGNEIAEAVTAANPRPVKLKFEKVYHPCVLLAKKRYVGYKYETRDQAEPEFDAKGIETVRRDGTPAEQMIEEKALRLLFETADLSRVKAYFQRQCDKIMRGAVSIQDFCFAKEVRLGTYSDKAPPPPGALISTRRMLEDARAEPQYGERVPYVVVTGAPGARLIDRCVAPEDLLASPVLMLDAEYYISKNIIPPLERIFNLVGASVRAWYDEMPRVRRVRRVDVSAPVAGARRTLEWYMRPVSCTVCGTKIKKTSKRRVRTANGDGEASLCARCRADVPGSLIQLGERLRREEQGLLEVRRVCQSCSGAAPLEDVLCDSRDCPVFYTRVKLAARVKTETGIVRPVIRRLERLGVTEKDLEW